ncbi:MAG: DUF5131 family protein [Planctomycetota bacterium]|jgi:protein gp37
MAETTGIEWCDATWNAWTGCTKVSAGCDNCYMYRQKQRWGHDPSVVTRSQPKTFNLPLAKKRDGSWKIPSGSFVFVCSWSDFFHGAVKGDWRWEVFGIMDQRPDLTFLVLSKRPELMRVWVDMIEGEWADSGTSREDGWISKHRHIWLGVTAENQAMADERIPKLLDIDWPGKKFISIEPMLGPVGIEEYLPNCLCDGCGVAHPEGQPHEVVYSSEDRFPELCGYGREMPGLDWIICGGESGPNHREIKLDWVRGLRDQCEEAGVPFFLKQYSAVRPEHMPELDGKVWDQRPEVG